VLEVVGSVLYILPFSLSCGEGKRRREEGGGKGGGKRERNKAEAQLASQLSNDPSHSFLLIPDYSERKGKEKNG